MFWPGDGKFHRQAFFISHAKGISEDKEREII